MAAVMASATTCPVIVSSSTLIKPSAVPLSAIALSSSRNCNFRFLSSKICLGFSHFSHWNSLKHVGVSIQPIFNRKEKKRGSRSRAAYASLFGVGAPEALVIGVVALLIFGPKGLAEVARTLGKTLKSFQPTIKELQEVSREFKSTLEREIGLDDLPPSLKATYGSSLMNESRPTVDGQNGSTPHNPSSSEQYPDITSGLAVTYASTEQLERKSDTKEQPQESSISATPSPSSTNPESQS